MANYDKRRIQVNAPEHMYFYTSFFECSTTELIERLKAIPTDHKAFIDRLEANNLNVPRNRRSAIDPTWYLIDEYRFDFDERFDDFKVNLQFFRWETDEEVAARIAKDEKRSKSAKEASLARKALEEKKEKELYLKLKEKYGDE